ncbi:MAG: flavodoxin [Ruminococcus sp.]|nr:flavodoxin [Ruminococcus sp.]
MPAAMVSGEETLTIADATLIQYFLAGIIERFPAEETEPAADTLVVVFSRTGNTRPLAQYAADYLNADFFEIEAAVPYTDADIAYYTNCRADQEQRDSTARPAIAGTVEHMEQYSTVVLAYPIWHGQAPKIIYTFLESYDFSGKTIIPFFTSASSPLGTSASNLHALAENAEWKEGRRFAAGTSQTVIEEWLQELGY